MITPVLPISRVAVVAVEPSSSPSTLLATSEAAASAAVVSTTTALSTAQVLAEQQFGEEEQQTAVNGEFNSHTDTFPSAITTTAATTTAATATAAVTITTATTKTHFSTTATSGFALPQKHDVSPKHYTATPGFFLLGIDEDENSDDGLNDGFAFFWPTPPSSTLHSVITSSPDMENLNYAPRNTQLIPAYSLQGSESALHDLLDDVVILKAYGPDGSYGKFTSSTSATEAESKQLKLITPLGNSSSKPDHEHSASSTFLAPLPSFLSSAAPPLPSLITSKMQTLSKTVTATATTLPQPNQNYFEDLWSDIAAPPVVIATGDEQPGFEAGATTATTTTTTSTTSTTTTSTATKEPLTAARLYTPSAPQAVVQTKSAFQQKHVTVSPRNLPSVKKSTLKSSTADESETGREGEEEEAKIEGSKKLGKST